MNIKEIKNERKEIDKLLRTEDSAKLKEKISNFLQRIKLENGKDNYEAELEGMFGNLRRYYMNIGDDIPTILYTLANQLSNVYIGKDNLEKAEDVLLSTISLIQDETKIKQVQKSSDEDLEEIRTSLIKVEALKCAKGEEKVSKAVEETKKLLREKGMRDFNEYEMFRLISEKLNITDFEGKLLQPIKGESANREKGKPSTHKNSNPLPDYLLPVNRLKFFMKEFPNMEIRRSIGKFEDYCVIEIPGLDSIIVERFFQHDKNGGISIAEGRDATYIVPKEFVLDLLELSKKDVREFATLDERIKIINHRSGTQIPIPENAQEVPYDSINYYRRFKTRFNASVGYEYFEGFGMNDKRTLRVGNNKDKHLTRTKESKNKPKEVQHEESLELEDAQKDETTSPINVDAHNDEKTEDRTLLMAQLQEAIAEVKKYTALLNQVKGRNQNDAEIKKKLVDAIEKLEKTNDKLRGIEQK